MKSASQPGTIITLTESAPLIGCSRQGAVHIANNDPEFPRPIDSISNGKTWLFWHKEIVAYVKGRAARAAAAESEAAATNAVA